MRGLLLGTALVVLVLVASVYAVVRARRVLRGVSQPATDARLEALLAAHARKTAEPDARRRPPAGGPPPDRGADVAGDSKP